MGERFRTLRAVRGGRRGEAHSGRLGPRRFTALLAFAFGSLVFVPTAGADDWMPRPADATWTYQWTNSVYNTVPTKEKITVKEQSGSAFVLAWTTEGMENPPEAPLSIGTVSFQETPVGIVNTDWSSTFPPPSYPILCPVAGGCNNSLSSTMYTLIWGTRGPVLATPLLKGTEWTSAGGARGDVTSVNEYVGTEPVSVPAFEQPVLAARVRSEVVQVGALGDPFGSGVRTVWWVYGVGPVKIVFEHGGADAPVTTAVLVETTLMPKPPPPDARYLPFEKGATAKFRWSNTKHMPKPSVQLFTVDESFNGSARVSVKHVSGPIRVAGTYGFTTRSDGITHLWTATQSATLAPLPPIGPRSLAPAKRRRFVTPLDFMVYGFNPILPAYPSAGTTWSAKVPSRDFSIFGVKGSTKVLGTRTLKVPAGTFRVLVVQSKLSQKGFKFGSGTRTAYFAPDKGLVLLVFRHGDGSVSRVERLK